MPNIYSLTEWMSQWASLPKSLAVLDARTTSHDLSSIITEVSMFERDLAGYPGRVPHPSVHWTLSCLGTFPPQSRTRATSGNRVLTDCFIALVEQRSALAKKSEEPGILLNDLPWARRGWLCCVLPQINITVTVFLRNSTHGAWRTGVQMSCDCYSPLTGGGIGQ